MPEVAASADQVTLTDQIDELSTRLILNGVATLSPADFERLGRAQTTSEQFSGGRRASDRGEPRVRLPLAAPERTRIASSGLDGAARAAGWATSGRQSMQRGSVAAIRREPLRHPSPAEGAIRSQRTRRLIREFITESSDHLAAIDSQLLLLEKDNSANRHPEHDLPRLPHHQGAGRLP